MSVEAQKFSSRGNKFTAFYRPGIIGKITQNIDNWVDGKSTVNPKIATVVARSIEGLAFLGIGGLGYALAEREKPPMPDLISETTQSVITSQDLVKLREIAADNNAQEQTQPVVDVFWTDVWPSWSPDGETLAFTGGDQGDIDVWTLDPADNKLTNLTGDVEAFSGYQSWSPDGEKIVYVSDAEGSFDIWVMNADGSEKIRLTEGEGVISNSPSWSPDGEKIAYVSDAEGSFDIWVMNADGSEKIRLTEGEGSEVVPTWSPDSTRIAYIAYGDNQTEVIAMEPESGERDVIFETTENISSLAWSPSGNDIGLVTSRVNEGSIWVISSDGEGSRKLEVERVDADSSLSWSPNGRQLTFVSNQSGNKNLSRVDLG